MHAVMRMPGELAADLLTAAVAAVLLSETVWHEEAVIVLLVFLCVLIS